MTMKQTTEELIASLDLNPSSNGFIIMRNVYMYLYMGAYYNPKHGICGKVFMGEKVEGRKQFDIFVPIKVNSKKSHIARTARLKAERESTVYSEVVG